MAILHYRITQANQNIVINQEVVAQSFILRRAVIKKHASPAATSPPYVNINGGGVIVNPSHLSGFEIVSGESSSSNDIVLGYNTDVQMTNTYYDMEFDSETIPRGFTVQCFNFDKSAPATFLPAGAPDVVGGEIISIDLFFQFSSLFDYEGY